MTALTTSLNTATMSELGVHQRYHLCSLSPAVGRLKAISLRSSPAEKARCVMEVQESIIECCKETDAPIGADDLLPLLTYVMARAQVPHLAAEVRYAVDFLAENLCSGEMGYYLTCMYAGGTSVLESATNPAASDKGTKLIASGGPHSHLGEGLAASVDNHRAATGPAIVCV